MFTDKKMQEKLERLQKAQELQKSQQLKQLAEWKKLKPELEKTLENAKISFLGDKDEKLFSNKFYEDLIDKELEKVIEIQRVSDEDFLKAYKMEESYAYSEVCDAHFSIVSSLRELEKLKYKTTNDLAKKLYYIQSIQIDIRKLDLLAQHIEKIITNEQRIPDQDKKVQNVLEALFGTKKIYYYSEESASGNFNKLKTFSIPIPPTNKKPLTISSEGLKKIIAQYKDSSFLKKLYQNEKHKESATLPETRSEQLKLMENTFGLLHDKKNPEYTDEEKAKIIKGLALVIKHQINHESLHTKSKLESMVNNLLMSPELQNNMFDATESMEAFNKFLNENFPKSPQTTNSFSDKMYDKTNMAVEDTKWQIKINFHLLYVRIDTITLSLSNTDISIASEQEKAVSSLKEKVINEDFYYRGELKNKSYILAKTTEQLIPEIDQRIWQRHQWVAIALEEFKTNPKDKAFQRSLSFQLQMAYFELRLTYYELKRIELKCDRLLKSNDVSDLEKLNKLKTALSEAQFQFIELENQCKAASQALTSEKPTLESKTTAEIKPKNNFNFFMRKHFQRNMQQRALVLQQISNLHISEKIGEDRLLAKTLSEDENPGSRNPTNILNSAREYYQSMNKTISTDNLPFKKLVAEIKLLTTCIENSETKLKNLLSTDNPGTPQQISDCLREINTEIEALRCLANIAELKIKASPGSYISITDNQVRELKEILSAPEAPQTKLTALQELRDKALATLQSKPAASPLS